jgi:hypothetical protein
MSKMCSDIPFGYLKHKLWPKEGPGIKVPTWLSITKSRESPWFTCLHVTCHISLEISWQDLQLFFWPNFNQRFAQEIMGLQSCGSLNFKNFETPNLGVLGQNDIWVHAPWPNTENTIRGKAVVSPKSKPCWVLWVYVYLWFICAPKVFKLRINQLVV